MSEKLDTSATLSLATLRECFDRMKESADSEEDLNPGLPVRCHECRAIFVAKEEAYFCPSCGRNYFWHKNLEGADELVGPKFAPGFPKSGSSG